MQRMTTWLSCDVQPIRPYLIKCVHICVLWYALHCASYVWATVLQFLFGRVLRNVVLIKIMVSIETSRHELPFLSEKGFRSVPFLACVHMMRTLLAFWNNKHACAGLWWSYAGLLVCEQWNGYSILANWYLWIALAFGSKYMTELYVCLMKSRFD